jgi:hypothetical protein
MKNKSIIFFGFIPLLFIICFFLFGELLYYIDNNFGSNYQYLSRNITDYLDIIGLFVSLAWTASSLFKDISDLKLNLRWIGILNVTTLSITAFMYLLHDIFNFSTVNNNLCDAGWNLVTFLWIFCVTMDYGYIRLLSYKFKKYNG